MAKQPGDAKIISDIIGQLAALEPDGLAQVAARAQELRQEKLQAATDAFIASVREQAAQLNLDPATVASMLMPAAPLRKASGASRTRGRGVVAVQFQGPDGETWSGRGKSPKWLTEAEKQGRSREDFRIKDNQPDLIETARREHAAAD